MLGFELILKNEQVPNFRFRLCLSGDQLVFRFEPFILAAECRDTGTALRLVACAQACGFRESGVTGVRRAIAGIRCSLRLEVAPLTRSRCKDARKHATNAQHVLLSAQQTRSSKRLFAHGLCELFLPASSADC